jgi:hypothetical protein
MMCWTVESHISLIQHAVVPNMCKSLIQPWFLGAVSYERGKGLHAVWARFFQNQKPYFPRIRLGFRCASMMALSEVAVSQNQVVIKIDI